MKSLLLTTLSAMLLISLQAQNYECIKPNAEYYYSDEENSTAIAIDSVQVIADTLIYFVQPSMVWNDTTGCFNRFGPSWIGKKVKQFPNGDHIFYNMNNQSIIIKTLAQTNEIWAAFTYDNGDYFQAKVVSVLYSTFLGIQDSVKKIVFLLKDANGNNLSHTLNNSFILLSKNYGLIKAHNFKLFPDLYEYGWTTSYCHSYNLAGINNPMLGMQNLTASEIFDINVGDEIHTYKHFWFWADFTQEIKMINHYINKTISNNGDTLLFTIKRCGRKMENIEGEFNLTLYNDTISQQVILSQQANLNVLFGQTIVDSTNTDYWEYTINEQNYYKTSELRKKNVTSMWYSEAPHDCIQMIITKDKIDKSTKELGANNFYIDGLGGPYHDYADFGVDIYEVSYFNKGDDEWGTPYYCDSLLIGINTVQKKDLNITIAPNPMKEMTRISIDSPVDENFSISIYNIMGEEVYEHIFRAGEIIISRSELSKGIYVIKISDPNSVLAIRKLIVE